MSQYSEEELAQLTPEERAFFENSDETEEASETDDELETPVAGTELDNEPETVETNISETVAEEKSDETKTQDDKVETPQVEQDNKQPTNSGSIPDYQLSEQDKERLSSIDNELESLAEKFDDGELSAKEFTHAQMKLMDEKSDIKSKMTLQQLSVDSQNHNWFQNTVPAFMGEHPEYHDEQGYAYQALNAEVTRLQENAIREGKPHLTQSILEIAHHNLMNMARQLSGQPPVSTKADTISEPVKAKPKAVERTMPPTLAHVPAAEITETTDGGKAGFLDRLADMDPIAQEEALAKLSDSERERYLSQP